MRAWPVAVGLILLAGGFAAARGLTVVGPVSDFELFELDGLDTAAEAEALLAAAFRPNVPIPDLQVVLREVDQGKANLKLTAVVQLAGVHGTHRMEFFLRQDFELGPVEVVSGLINGFSADGICPDGSGSGMSQGSYLSGLDGDELDLVVSMSVDSCDEGSGEMNRTVHLEVGKAASLSFKNGERIAIFWKELIRPRASGHNAG